MPSKGGKKKTKLKSPQLWNTIWTSCILHCHALLPRPGHIWNCTTLPNMTIDNGQSSLLEMLDNQSSQMYLYIWPLNLAAQFTGLPVLPVHFLTQIKSKGFIASNKHAPNISLFRANEVIYCQIIVKMCFHEMGISIRYHVNIYVYQYGNYLGGSDEQVYLTWVLIWGYFLATFSAVPEQSVRCWKTALSARLTHGSRPYLDTVVLQAVFVTGRV